MEQAQDTTNTDDAQSRVAEGEANLTDVLGTSQTCDVRGLLFGGLAVCRHHEGGGGNRCHYNYGCEHQVPNAEITGRTLAQNEADGA